MPTRPESRASEPARRQVYLHPGGVFVSAEPCSVTTILGTCVSVCLFDARRGIGGLNHFLLPFRLGEAQECARFGSTAMSRLHRELVVRGADPRALQAKLFGGKQTEGSFPRDLGTRNAELAVELLKELEIPIAAADVGGCKGRKLVFHTDDGAAWVKAL